MAEATDVDLSCGICKQTFKNPKFLSCFHTFCEECLLNMVRVGSGIPLRHSSGTTLRCPACRAEVTLPPGGVPELQSNFYIAPLLSPELCQRHVGMRLEFRCKEDNTVLCVSCKLVDHDNHPVEELGKAILDAKTDLGEDLKRFERRKAHLDTKRDQRLKSLVSFKAMVEAQKELVMKQEERSIAIVKEWREEMIKQLESSQADCISQHEEEEKRGEEKRATLECLQQEVTQASEGATSQTLLALSDRMRHGRGSEQQLGPLETSDLPAAAGLVLLYEDDCLQRRGIINNSLGRLVRLQGTLRQVFRCVADPNDSQVYAICICTNGFVIAAYGSGEDGGDGWVSKFTPSGDPMEWEPQAIRGRVGLIGLNEGAIRVEGREFPAKNFFSEFVVSPLSQGEGDVDKVYDVYNKLHARFLLRVSSSEHCHLRSVQIEADRRTTDSKIFDVNVKDPIAMDASQNGRLFAVVEKGQDQVTFYCHGNAEPYAVYNGNGGTFKPVDVCFYFIGDKETLVIADWMNDLLHVLDVSEGCALIGQVGGECPYLTQPTALCAEKKGTLWIGCQDGRVLALTHL